jgi:integrase
MRGSIARRGRESWRLRFDVGVDANGKRKVQSVTVRGTKRQAQTKLTELLAAVDMGGFVAPSKVTVAEHVRARLAQWTAAGEIGEKTLERYAELIENQIVPHIGAKILQRLRPIDIEAWHTTLRTGGRKGGGGLSARTIGHAHRLLSKSLREAVKFELALRNVAGRDGQRAPRVHEQEIAIIPADRIGEVVERLRGRAIYPKVIVALFTGMRRSEILALRWSNIDLTAKEIRVREAIEETKRHGLRFKSTKTKNGRRDIALPEIVVDALAEHRRLQLEWRMKMGLGRSKDDLVFPALHGGPQSPHDLSGDWRELAATFGLGDVTFHGLRHTHASQLIAAGVDVVRVSKRLGHASPKITLAVYEHMFNKRDDISAAAINAALHVSRP